MGAITGFQVAGGNFVDFLNYLASLGFFSHILPFLLIFAIVFGVLSATQMFGKNKAVMAIIAISVGLLSLQFNIVSNFFATIFPYAGVGLSILLIFMIFLGLFVDPTKRRSLTAFYIIAVVTLVFIIFAALTSYGTWEFGYWFDQYKGWVITILVIVGVAAAVIGGGGITPEGREEGVTLVPWRQH